MRAIADHLSEFDEAALLILPCQENNEPILQQDPDQFGIQLAQNPPAVCRALCIDLAILLPKLEKQFDLPAFTLQNDRLFQAEQFSRGINEQEQPLAKLQSLSGDLLGLSGSLREQPLTSLLGDVIGDP